MCVCVCVCVCVCACVRVCGVVTNELAYYKGSSDYFIAMSPVVFRIKQIINACCVFGNAPKAIMLKSISLINYIYIYIYIIMYVSVCKRM